MSISTKYVKECQLFALSGPTLFCWLYGILFYPFKSKEFIAAFQNGLISITYLSLYGVIYIISLFSDSNIHNVDIYIYSLLSSLYIGVTLYIYQTNRRKGYTPGYEKIESLLDRIIVEK